MIVNKTLKFIVPLLNIEKSKIITKDFKGAYNCFKVNEDPYQVYLHYNCQNNNLTTNYFNYEGTVYKLDSKNLSKEIKCIIENKFTILPIEAKSKIMNFWKSNNTKELLTRPLMKYDSTASARGISVNYNYTHLDILN